MLRELFINLCLLISIHYVLRFTFRSWPTPRRGLPHAARLAAFAAASLLLLLFPAHPAPGVVVDLRAVPVAFVTLYFGGWAGLITALPVIAYRVWLGGVGVYAAVPSLLAVIAVAALLRRRLPAVGPLFWPHWPGLILIFGVNGLPLLLLPGGPQLFAQVYPLLLLTNVLGALIAWGILSERFHVLRLTSQWQSAAMTDPLTHLGNRRQFDLDLTAMGPGDALLLVDIDHFKRVNDTFGHPVGDEVLQEVAQVLQREGRGRDRAYRYGGEEFAVILRDVPETSLTRVAERLRLAVQQLPLPVINHPVTVSIGAASWRPISPAQLVERADEALYRAKAGGRNAVCLWTPAAAAPTPTETRAVQG
ncbi:GGDEF domain-containing protein [Deinococcus radiotolerans]|uniref:GGDEF domain-containing protein n=1 Tax=Deinococcus radiotolerans TaxID=1309407 RepID=A0ABQ2FFA5_9DEIO|nr:diguanylate cyclase [Deinococcus radiotolerans]GGK92759.1 GGDEF domain-containing protein [Deinococcus radiotolerans]